MPGLSRSQNEGDVWVPRVPTSFLSGFLDNDAFPACAIPHPVFLLECKWCSQQRASTLPSYLLTASQNSSCHAFQPRIPVKPGRNLHIQQRDGRVPVVRDDDECRGDPSILLLSMSVLPLTPVWSIFILHPWRKRKCVWLKIKWHSCQNYRCFLPLYRIMEDAGGLRGDKSREGRISQFYFKKCCCLAGGAVPWRVCRGLWGPPTEENAWDSAAKAERGSP